MNSQNENLNIGTSKVAGIVVLYNPEKKVIENIYSYLNQVDSLFVVDNSDEESTFIKDEFQSQIEYIFCKLNIGVAAALNLGADKAINHGYKFLLTMDQDSKAPSELVNILLKVFDKYDNVGIVSPLHSNRFGNYSITDESIQKLKIVMTSGNLISLNAYNDIGKFCEDYFIDYVDIEFCFRMYLNNYGVYQVNNVKLNHSEAAISQVNLHFVKYHPFNHQPFRFYYKTRNLLYLREQYKTKAKDLLKKEYDAYLRGVFKALLFEKNKLKKIRMILLGIIDYLKKQKGHKFF